jgi:L-asparagine transporter-like permease
LLVICVGTLTQFRLPAIQLMPATAQAGPVMLDINLPAGKAPFDVVTDFAMFGAVAFETLVIAAIFVFRWRIPLAPRSYRCLGYPIVPALYVLIMAAVLTNMFNNPEQRSESIVGLGFIAIGAVVYQVLFAGTQAPTQGIAPGEGDPPHLPAGK